MSNHTKFSTYLNAIFRDYKIYFIGLSLISIIAAIFSIAVNYKTKEIIDAIALNPHANIGTLLILFVVYRLMHHGMFFISRLFAIRYRPRLLLTTINEMYTRTVKHSLHWFDSHLSGEISGKIFDFQIKLFELITHGFHALNNIAVIMISIMFLLRSNALSAIVLSVFMIIYIPVITFLLKRQMHLQKQYVTAKQETLGIINDSIANIFGIKIIGNIWTELKLKLTPALLYQRDWDKKTRKFDAYYVDNADTIMVTIMSAVQVYLLAYLYQSGQITAGDFAFISMITLNIHGRLDELLESLLFTINPAIASMKASFTFINCDYDTPDYPDAKIITNVRGDIRFQNVYFAYSGSHTNILNNFNLHIQAGQRIGIVGTSGAGKTTLIKCLLRYFDVQQGQILIDGQNIKAITQDSLRGAISVIPQDITMLHRSILENLQLAKYDASFEEIVAACKKASVHKDIELMPHGYHSTVGERGVKVSGGQRQRIAIARAILKNAPILILDEATSALDTPTEQLIQRSLNEIFETSHATTIVIAHRLSTLLHMDRILVIEQGQIIEDGRHQELLAKGGLYQTLWNAQVGGFLPGQKNRDEL